MSGKGSFSWELSDNRQPTHPKPKAQSPKPPVCSLQPPASCWRLLPLAAMLLCSLGCTLAQIEEKELTSEEVSQLRDKGIKFSKANGQEPTIEALIDFGNLQANVGNHQQARNLFQEALERDKKCVPAYVGMAKVYILQKNPALALEVLEQAKRYGPKSPQVFNESAVALAQMEDYPGAIQAAEKALQLEPKNELYMTNLANMLAITGELERSFALFSQLLSPADAHFRIAGILFGQNQLAACEAQLHLALQADPKHEQAAATLKKLEHNPPESVAGLSTVPKDGVK